MSKESSLIPIEERTVVFYDDTITAVLVSVGDENQIFVPIRPICDFLGIDWSSQRRRITGDPVLSMRTRSVAVTATEAGGKREMTCLPIDYLNGWLFGVSANRIKDEEIRRRLIRYQDECYRVLSRAFRDEAETAVSPNLTALAQVREMGLAIVRMAEEQIEFEKRLTTSENKLNQAVTVVGDIDKRLSEVERKLSPGESVTDDQASQISQAVKAVAIALGSQTKRNEFGAVYGEMYRKFGITSYKLLPAAKFKEAMAWLSDWYSQLTDGAPF